MKSVAVFCGSNLGSSPVFNEAAIKLGYYLAEHQIKLIYGGGKIGLMGAIANAALAKGGEVYGVIPEKLKDRELAHPGLTELTVVADMHERKAKMAQLSDGFIAMPGGSGTLEEISEVWTWAQLGYHHKPCGFYNINGFYDPLLLMVDRMVKQGFLRQAYCDMLQISDSPHTLLHAMRDYVPPADKWQ
ncbi:TIGR00730 family Rossman fold protein [Celerinatantimonas sp. MCCC 1A17872]|uniref:LOG family protein n=1 Tax=Celerinatantimonas sp. MCCC 1A17872 TaxID=3177514 RepID=UPI0038BF3FF8